MSRRTHNVVLPEPEIHQTRLERPSVPIRDEAVRTVEWAKGLPDTRDIYVCMSSQRTAQEKTSKNGHKYLAAIRNQENAVALKSLFIDLDAKGTGQKLVCQPRQGDRCVGDFSATGLPKPSMVVGSGGGLHVYWTLMRALSPDEWRPLAYALAEATKQVGLKCDTQCTIDSARILRVPDTLNHKTTPGKPVALACSPTDSTTP